jgi:hypothetical protein
VLEQYNSFQTSKVWYPGDIFSHFLKFSTLSNLLLLLK